MCATDNWLEDFFREYAESLNSHYVIYYPDDPNHRGNTPPDFCLMGSPNILVECKYFSTNQYYYLDRVSKNQYYKLNMDNRFPNIQSYVCVAYGEPENYKLYMIPWSAYKKWFTKYNGNKLKFTWEEFDDSFHNFRYWFKKGTFFDNWQL